jgi:hypothetical protein
MLAWCTLPRTPQDPVTKPVPTVDHLHTWEGGADMHAIPHVVGRPVHAMTAVLEVVVAA